MQGNPNPQIAENSQNLQAQNQDVVPVQQTPATHEVRYTDEGYVPSTITIKVGDTVMFKNESSKTVWTGSAMHPTHMVYSGTDLKTHCPDPENISFDQCKAEGPGTSWLFTFTKAGTWGYHNHVGPTHFGKVIVEQ